jgi:hypothetical protein
MKTKIVKDVAKSADIEYPFIIRCEHSTDYYLLAKEDYGKEVYMIHLEDGICHNMHFNDSDVNHNLKIGAWILVDSEIHLLE